MATNFDIVLEASAMVGYEFDGTNLKTFMEWKKAGFTVKKGEKAFMKLDLWKPFTAKVKDKDGNVELDEKGKEKTETRFKLVPSALFTPEQVEKADGDKPSKKKATSKKKAPKKATKKATVKVVAKEEKKEVVETPQPQETENVEAEIKTAWFSRKASDVEDVLKDEYKDCDRYRVMDEVEIELDEFTNLSNNLLADNDLLVGQGGTLSTTDPCPDEDKPLHELTEKQQNLWKKGAYRACLKVSCKSASYSLIIDPQGYNYARYVAIETK